jgi:D-alanyl-D-alanine carboxypeptidase
LGRAVDINPIQNPYREGNVTSPEAERAYDQPYKRRSVIVGNFLKGGLVTRGFARQGGGGDWKNTVDYQHFSSDGH